MHVLLLRDEHSDHGTLGRLLAGDYECHTLEPPWRDNRPGRSCIPRGTYACGWHRSPRFGWVYLVGNVTGRSHILIHPGNVGGDVELGLHTHTLGCVLLGTRRGELKVKGQWQRAVLASRPAVGAFFNHMGQQPFRLEVQSC